MGSSTSESKEIPARVFNKIRRSMLFSELLLIISMVSPLYASNTTPSMSPKGWQLQIKKRGLKPNLSVKSAEEEWIMHGDQSSVEITSDPEQRRVSHYRFIKEGTTKKSLDVSVKLLKAEAYNCNKSSRRSFVRFLIGGFYFREDLNRKVFAGIGIGKFSGEKSPFAFYTVFSGELNFFVLDEFKSPNSSPVRIHTFQRIGQTSIGQLNRLGIEWKPSAKQFSFRRNDKKFYYDYLYDVISLGQQSRRDIGIALFSPQCSLGQTSVIRVSINKNIKLQ